MYIFGGLSRPCPAGLGGGSTLTPVRCTSLHVVQSITWCSQSVCSRVLKLKHGSATRAALLNHNTRGRSTTTPEAPQPQHQRPLKHNIRGPSTTTPGAPRPEASTTTPGAPQPEASTTTPEAPQPQPQRPHARHSSQPYESKFLGFSSP